MPAQPYQDDQFTFVAGLNTEAGFFGFPANTWKDGVNMVPNVNGSIRKRVAIDIEAGGAILDALTEAERNDWAFTTETWQAVGGNGDLNFAVVQIGEFIYFYQDTANAMSATRKSFYIDLELYKASGYTGSTGAFPIALTSANGRCIITSKCIDPLIVEYLPTTDDIDVTSVTIQIRDFKGMEDSLAIDARPSTLSNEHKYNLLNQGWDNGKITTYYNSASTYPSNAQSWVYGKDSNDDFSAAVLNKQDFGTSPAPRGRYILDAFNENRATASGIAGIPNVTETTRPSTCAFYAGRAWYSGVGGTRLLSNVYFSQVATESETYGRCYQSADPTSEIISDLVDTDGGVIPIQDCGEIISLVATGTGVLVLATNGVWQIVGTAQGGFTATGYEVNKLSNYGCISAGSVVQVNDTVVYWSYSAICQIAASNVGSLVVSPLTDTTIKSLYVGIPTVAKKYASGAFNSSSRIIYWAYNNTLSSSEVFPYKKDTILALDTRIGAFYILSLPKGDAYPAITWVTTTKESTENQLSVPVQVGTEDVFVGSVLVETIVLTSFASERQFKFLTITPDGGVTFSDFLTLEEAPIKYKDWYSYDDVGVPFDAFVLTGLNFASNGPAKMQQALYVSTFMGATETGFTELFDPINASSCTIQGRWDFTNSSVANKWSIAQQIYKRKRVFVPDSATFDLGYSVIISKTKIRGRGKALQLKFEAQPDYDCVLLGWSVLGYGATNV